MKKLLFLLVLMPLLLVAQSYNLEQLVNYGLEHSWEMQRSSLDFENSRSSFRSSKWNLLPELRVFAGANQDFTDNAAPASDLSSSAGFSISKSISLNDPAYFQYRFAKLDLETAELNLEQERRSYVFDVFKAYLEVLSAQKRLSSLTENLRIQTRVLEQSRVLLQLGKNTSFDVKQSEIAVMNSQIQIMQLENTIESSRRTLFNLVQMPDEGLALDDVEYVAAQAVPALETDAINRLQVLEQSIGRSALSLKQARLDNFPSVSLSYDFRRTVGGQDFDFDTYSTNHGLSLSLSYSLLSPFKQREVVSRFRLNRQLAELNRNSALTQINTQYDQLSRQLSYLERLAELYREKLEQSREQIRIAEERYRLGLIELLELDKTRTEYIDADIAYNANQYQLIQTREELNLLLSRQIMGTW
jgi:outer membrane protein